MAKRLSEKQLAAVEYLAAPKKGGLTNDQIADEVGVDRATLYRWKNDEDFNKAVQKKVVRNVNDRLGGMFDAAINSVEEEHNAAMFRTILQAAGMLTEKHEVETKKNDSKDVSELKAEIERFKARGSEEDSEK